MGNLRARLILRILAVVLVVLGSLQAGKTPARADNCVIQPRADLTSCEFLGMDLKNADFSNTNLTMVSFANSDLSGAKFDGAVMQNTGFSSAILVGASFTDANMGAGIDLTLANLTGASFIRTRLTDVGFQDADLTNVTSSGVSGTILGDANPSFAHWHLRAGLIIGPRVSLANAHLSGETLCGLNLDGINLENADLSNTCSNGSFRGANLRGVNFTGATADGADFSDSDLTGANLSSAHLMHAKFDRAILTNTVWTGAVIPHLSNAPAPRFRNTFRVGMPVNVVVGDWDQGVALEYRWLRNNTQIDGASSASYTLSGADFGCTIKLMVIGRKPGYMPEVRFSLGAKPSVGFLPPVKAAVLGSAKVGKTLTAKVTGQLFKVSQQWLLDGKPIRGATSSTYKLLVSQKGHSISLRINETALGYTPISITTKPVKIG